MIKFLKYPASSAIDTKNEKRIRYSITTLMMVMIVPSFYLAYNLFDERRFTKTVEEFVNSEFSDRGYTVIYKKLNYRTHPKKVELAFLNRKLTKEDMDMYNRLLAERGSHNTLIHFRQVDADLKAEILNEVNKQNASLSEKDIIINNLRKELHEYKVNELSILFPELKDVVIAKVEQHAATDTAKLSWLVLYQTDKSSTKIERTKITSWLSQRLLTEDILVIRNLDL